MADAVTTIVYSDTGIRYRARFTNVSDGTGESAVRKVDLTDISAPENSAKHPKSLSIEKVEATVSGFDSVSILWDRDPTNVIAVTLPAGHSDLCFKKSRLKDPKHGQAGTGDILLTTNGSATSQDSYVINIDFKCNY